jgi:hypothetical protein
MTKWRLLSSVGMLVMGATLGCQLDVSEPSPGLVFKCSVQLICGGVGDMTGTSQECITSQEEADQQATQAAQEATDYARTHCNGYAINGQCRKTYETCLDNGPEDGYLIWTQPPQPLGGS